MTSFSRIVLMTPRIGGADGVSAVSRQYLRVIEQWASDIEARVEVWTLCDEPRPAGVAERLEFYSAADSQIAFAARAVRASSIDSSVLVLVMHLHLLPVTLPLEYRGARVVTLLHGVEAWKPLRPLQRLALSHGWRTASVSAHTAARFRASNPEFAALPIRVCHSSVGDLVMPARRSISASPYALIVGRMAEEERYKGHDLLLDIWSRVRQIVPGARLVITGDGNDRARLQQKSAALGYGDAVQFTGGVTDEALAALYRDAAMFVMPSRDEGLGLVFLEAMRAGTPCIAATGAAEEVIDDGVNGLIVDSADSQALVDAITRLFEDTALRERLGDDARRRVMQHFGPDAFAARARDLLGLTSVPVAC